MDGNDRPRIACDLWHGDCPRARRDEETGAGMIRRRPEFVKLPTGWLEDGGLKAIRWDTNGSDGTAALMALTIIAHNIDPESGTAHVTYDMFAAAAGGMSKAKISAALRLLTKHGRIDRENLGQSTYSLSDYDPYSGWAKLPCRGLYNGDAIDAFSSIKLRSRVELNALKLFYAIAARRDRKSNLAFMTYDQIYEYAGIRQGNIREAISWLISNGVILTEKVPSRNNPEREAQGFRLRYIESFSHGGTVGRRADFDSSEEVPF